MRAALGTDDDAERRQMIAEIDALKVVIKVASSAQTDYVEEISHESVGH